MLLKFINIFNWLIVAILAFLVIMETLNPSRGGGDAAGRGLGQALYYLTVIALLILLALNLLPFKATKYIAFGLVVVPVLYIWIISPILQKVKRGITPMFEQPEVIFEDPTLDRLAKAIEKGEVEKLSPPLPTSPDLLAFAIVEANQTSYKPAEKLECLKKLFAAGARLDSIDNEVPMHFAAGESGNEPLMRCLLEQGADPNAVQPYFKRFVIFEAIGSWQQPAATVRTLLEFGADPENKCLMDDEVGPETALEYAARRGRWDVCMVLLEHKAKATPAFLQTVKDAENDNTNDGYSRRADYEQLQQRLVKK